MFVVGLNAFHPDSAACAVVDGKLVAAIAEERLGPRHKHTAGFPGRALQAVLKIAGATIRDVDCLAIGNDSNANLAAKISHVFNAPLKSARGVVTHFQRRLKMRGFRELIAESCGAPEADGRLEVVRLEQHTTHVPGSRTARAR